MVKEAEAHADEDRKRREEAEVRNQADNVIYQTEKSLKEHGDKLDESDRKPIEDALSEAKEAIKGSDVDQIRSSSDSLMTASQKIAEVIYRSAQDQTAEAAAPASESTDDVVDAEVVEDDGQESA
jgi:molecular chaperone DnaK